MSVHEDEPLLWGGTSQLTKKSTTLQEKVAQFYYSQGLFCSTYPATVLFLAISIALLCCFPLINLPLPGNTPQQQWISSTNLTTLNNIIKPFGYVQQVVIKIAVLPWDENQLTLGDAFRAPIYESFKLLEIIRNYQDKDSLKTLGHVCLHVEAIRRISYKNILPQYSCLVLSPANLWQQDVQKFSQDTSLLTTIFNQHSFQKGKTSITEMLFGMHMFDTGIKRYPLRSRQRVIQYAVTLFFKEYDEHFINGLHKKLQTIYPIHQNLTRDNTNNDDKNDTVLIDYPNEINFLNFIPLTITIILVFIYYYYSVRKMELIKSKLLMAFAVIITVLGSYTMTLGLCFFFGLTLNLNSSKELFPYLLLLIGLENVLVLTKSVLTTPQNLDIKIRIAKGLSKEGWSITKNLLLELTILTIGLFTFVPTIQELCIFTIVGSITDYFLQMFFFSTILSIDIRRMEILTEKTNPNNYLQHQHQRIVQQQFYNRNNTSGGMIINRSKSYPRLITTQTYPANIIATNPTQNLNQEKNKIPKRLRLINLWTRTRFFQRSFMVLMVTWICRIAYNSGIIEHYIINNTLFQIEKNTNNIQQQNYSSIKLFHLLNNTNYNNNNNNQKQQEQQEQQSDDLLKLKHSNYAPWLKLSLQHWPSIFRKYNISLSGHLLAILPNIQISHIINPEQAKLLRNPDEKYGEKFQWQALAAALDPIDFHDLESNSGKVQQIIIPQSERPFYPQSVLEIGLTTILCLISIIVMAYIFVVLYRCICSRNYAEWRASWFNNNNINNTNKNVDDVDEQHNNLLFETLPIVLNGHQQEIECIASDGINLVSSCLNGQLKIWDTSTGELLTNIDRKTYFNANNDNQKEIEQNNQSIENLLLINNDLLLDDLNNSSDYESGSPPSRDEIFQFQFPQLKNRINTNFLNTITTTTTNKLLNEYNSKVEFNKFYKQLYLNYDNTSSSSSITKTNDTIIIDNNNSSSGSSNSNNTKLSPIWCLDYLDNLIVIGCADGRLEFWDSTTSKLKCLYYDENDTNNIGISHLKLIGSKLIVTRLYGTLDLFHLQTYNQGRSVDWNFTTAYRRTHMRTGSVDSSITSTDDCITKQNYCEEEFRCIKITSIKAHQQPITCMDCEGGRLLTGSQDHTLKVFRLDDGNLLYTLHGHCGPITCLFIDRISPATSGSGSQDGMLCVWDLLTGTCMYSVQAHDGSVTSLTYSASYVISLGTDDRLCVWERFQGHLLNTIHISQAFSISQILMLAPHLAVTARNSDLVIWDVRSGECVRTIQLGPSPFIFIKQLILLRDAILCDYGNQLRIIRFPLITHKFD